MMIETSTVLSAIDKASSNARALADVCFYALESGILVVDRILSSLKDQLYGETSKKEVFLVIMK